MDALNTRKLSIIFAHAFVGWALCGAMMGIGGLLTTMENTIIFHDFGVPVLFFFISLVYFKRFHFASPLHTAILFCSFAVFMDVFVVSMIFLKSFEMFKSITGTWIPLASILLTTYATGLYVERRGARLLSYS